MVDPRGESDTPPCGNHNDIIGQFPTMIRGRGRGDYAELYITWCVLWFHWFGPSGISPSRGQTIAQSPHDPFPGQHLHPSSSSLNCREISTQNNDMICRLSKYMLGDKVSHGTVKAV